MQDAATPEAAALPPLPPTGSPADAPLARIETSFVRSLFGESGDVSSMRAVFVLATLLIVLAWAVISVHAGALQPLPESIVAALGILTGGKLWQNSQEASSSKSE